MWGSGKCVGVFGNEQRHESHPKLSESKSFRGENDGHTNLGAV